MMLWAKSGFLITVAMGIAIAVASISQEAEKYYVESPLFNFFIAHGREIRTADAQYIFKTDVTNCTCKHACFSAVKCQSWSVSSLPDGTAECRLSNKQMLVRLDLNPAATYFFKQGNNCVFGNVTAKAYTLLYDQQMLEDVAFMKTTTSSSVSSSFLESNANDGDNTTTFSSMAELKPYWIVDLGTRKTVFHMMILPRQDCCFDNFLNVTVQIGDVQMSDGSIQKPNNLYKYPIPYNVSSGMLNLSCRGATGRYIVFTINTGNTATLELNSVQVYALKEK